jgi:hypothetical protein
MSMPDMRTLTRALNTGAALLGADRAPFVSLAPERLVADARDRARLDDFGEPDLEEPLRRLTASYDREAGLTVIGRIAARQDTVRLLVNRLRMQEDRRRQPGIGEQAVERPLFVTGLPRTGTTFLHGLLAQDPANRVPYTWEAMFPSPPARSRRGADRRLEQAERQIRWFHRLNPDFRRIHPLGARLPDECLIITSHSLASFQFQTSHRVPSYQAWLERQDLRACYAAHRRFLQHLQWRGPAGRWVLKAPAHLFGLRALFETYPDAGVVVTHRDPLEVVASLASLHTTLRSTFSDDVDPIAVGAEVTRRWAEGLARGQRARDAGCAPPARFLDVRYTDLVRDPIATVRLIYRQFDLRWSDAVEARMRHFLATNPRGKYGEHRYTLEQFGLDRDEEAERFRAYRERFAP